MKEEATQAEETELFQVTMSAKHRGSNLWVYIYGASKTHCLTINSNGAIQIEVNYSIRILEISILKSGLN